MKVFSNDTVAICIDFQEKLLPSINNWEEIISNSIKLIKGLDILGVPIVFTQQYTKGLGETYKDIRNSTKNFRVFEKSSFSAYENDVIKSVIDNLNIKNVVLFGIEAHICVLQTLIDLRLAGYNVFIVENCIGSRKLIDKDCAIKRAIYEGAAITTFESILFEFTIVSQTEQFKNILDIIK